MISVGIDPGVRNFAVVVIGHDGRITFARMLKTTIRSMARDAAPQRVAYRLSVRAFLRHFKPDEVIVETFVARGFGTHLGEVVNVMIGSLMSECDHLNIDEHATMASSWKNALGRHYAWHGYVPPANPKKRGKAATGQLYALAGRDDVPPHFVDALLLATYLRHGKDYVGADWWRVRSNIRLLNTLVPVGDRLRQASRKRKQPKP